MSFEFLRFSLIYVGSHGFPRISTEFLLFLLIFVDSHGFGLSNGAGFVADLFRAELAELEGYGAILVELFGCGGGELLFISRG